jgi:L-serine dehydratase
MARFREIVGESGQSLDEIMLANEKAIRRVSEGEIYAHLDLVLTTMEEGVRRGLSEEGLLPAPFEFYRKAKQITNGRRRQARTSVSWASSAATLWP